MTHERITRPQKKSGRRLASIAAPAQPGSRGPTTPETLITAFETTRTRDIVDTDERLVASLAVRNLPARTRSGSPVRCGLHVRANETDVGLRDGGRLCRIFDRGGVRSRGSDVEGLVPDRRTAPSRDVRAVEGQGYEEEERYGSQS
jgi:hypothetical protein